MTKTFAGQPVYTFDGPNAFKGKEWIPAPRGIDVNVRQRDIDAAIPQSGNECVFAQCALRALDAVDVHFYRTVAYVQFDEGQPYWKLEIREHSPAFTDVIEPLDRGDFASIRPGIYRLEKPRAGKLWNKLDNDKRHARRAAQRAGEREVARPWHETKPHVVGRLRTASR
jgi:hypothetical protein